MSKLIEIPETTCYPALMNRGIKRKYYEKLGKNPVIEREIIILKDGGKWVYIKEICWCVLYKDYDLWLKKQDK